MASTGSSFLAEATLDARGLRCPLPVLKLEKRLGELPPGAQVTVLATDPIAKIDIPLFCTQNGHVYEMTTEGEVMRFAITKGAAA